MADPYSCGRGNVAPVCRLPVNAGHVEVAQGDSGAADTHRMVLVFRVRGWFKVGLILYLHVQLEEGPTCDRIRAPVCRWGQISSLFVSVHRKSLLRPPGDTLEHSLEGGEG